jgi:hypothetical protein
MAAFVFCQFRGPVNETWAKCCRKIPAETLYRPVTPETRTNKAERQTTIVCLCRIAEISNRSPPSQTESPAKILDMEKAGLETERAS